MEKNQTIIKILKLNGFNKLHIEEILNYLETLEYDLERTNYIGNIFSKNERLAKYFFLRDQLKINNHAIDNTSHIYEILDQCVDWTEFWRLLVIKKGFCCISLSGKVQHKKRYIFLSGPNILCSPFADESSSIHQDDDL